MYFSTCIFFFFDRQRKEKDELEKRHEKELSTFKKKVENRKLRLHNQRSQQQQQQLKDAFQAQMKKEKLKEQQQGMVQRNKSSTEEPVAEPTDHSKINGCSPETLSTTFSVSKKSFSGIDKEIEQLAQFESKTKKKPPSSVVPGQVSAAKMEQKLSLNQIKVNQLQRERVVPVEVPPGQTATTPGPTRSGPQVVSQATVSQQPLGSFSGPRNTSYSNLQAPQGTQVPVTSYSGAVINGPWPGGPDNVQWAPSMEEHQWHPVGEPQSPWPAGAEGNAWPVAVNSGSNSSGQYVVRMSQPYVPAANVAGQSYVVQTVPHQQMPHR